MKRRWALLKRWCYLLFGWPPLTKRKPVHIVFPRDGK